MSQKTWSDVVDEDFPKTETLTKEMQEEAFKQIYLMRGSVRLTMKRLPTSQEIEERRRRAMEKPLV